MDSELAKTLRENQKVTTVAEGGVVENTQRESEASLASTEVPAQTVDSSAQTVDFQAPTAAIEEVQAEIQEEAKEHPKNQEELFAEGISKVLLDDELFSHIREDKKEEFPGALNDFIIENFWNKRQDENLDQVFAAQEAFKDANKLFEYFESQKTAL